MTFVREALAVELEQIADTAISGTQVFPFGEVPTPPPATYVTYIAVAAEHVRHMTAGAGLTSPRYQVDVWADSSSVATMLADAIREYLNDRVGAIGSATQARGIRRAFLEDETTTFEPPVDGSDTGKHRVQMDFTIWHTETITPVQ